MSRLNARPVDTEVLAPVSGPLTITLIETGETDLSEFDPQLWVQPLDLDELDREHADAVSATRDDTDIETGRLVFTIPDCSLLGDDWRRLIIADGATAWVSGHLRASIEGAPSQSTVLPVRLGAGEISFELHVTPGGGAGGGADLSDADPEPPGAASPGTAEEASRADHVHAPPTLGQIGAVADDDPRLSDSRPPTGGAGGFLSGSYPNPGVNLEALQDAVAGMIAAGANISVTYFDETGTITIAASGLQATSAKDQPGGYAGLNGDGQIATSALPALAIGETYTVGSEVEMLALDVQRGDVAIRSDEDRVYRVIGDDPTELTDWVLLPVPADVVQSVNGQQGIIVLSYADVGADPSGAAATAQAYAVQRSNHTGTQAISTVSGLQAALDAKSATGHGHAISDVTGLQAALDGKAPATRTVGTGLGTSGTVDLDMSALHGTIQTITLTGSTTFTTSNKAAGREVTLVLAAGGSSRTLTWPSWTAVGAALPTTLASGKTLVVTVTFTGTTEASGVAAAAAQP